jgi:hypothetical protein
MEMNVGMCGQPSVTFFVRAVVVQDHVQFHFGGGLGYHLVHKLQELFPSFQLREGGAYFSRRHLQSRKQVERPVPFVGAAVSPHDFALGGFHIAGLALQGLDAGLFIDTNHQVCSAKSTLTATFARFSCCNLFQPVFMVQTSKDGPGYNSLTTRNSVT